MKNTSNNQMNELSAAEATAALTLMDMAIKGLGIRIFQKPFNTGDVESAFTKIEKMQNAKALPQNDKK